MSLACVADKLRQSPQLDWFTALHLLVQLILHECNQPVRIVPLDVWRGLFNIRLLLAILPLMMDMLSMQSIALENGTRWFRHIHYLAHDISCVKTCSWFSPQPSPHYLLIFLSSLSSSDSPVAPSYN